LRSHKVTKLQVVLLVSLVVLVGAAVVYRSFAGTNAGYVPKGVVNLNGNGRAIKVNPTATGGYTMDAHGQLFGFSIGTNGKAPFALPTTYYSSTKNARDFIVLNWNSPGILVLSGDGQLHSVGNRTEVTIENVATATARKIVMYDTRRGYILDGAGRFIRFAVNGATLPPVVSGFRVRDGQDVARSAVINPNQQHGYLVTSDGNVHEFRLGNNVIAPAVSAGTTWPGVNKAIDIVMSNWVGRQGYVIASDGGWYAFNGAPNDYSKKSGAPFNFGTSIRGFYQVPGKSAYEVNSNGTVYVFSLPNYLVAQNNKEIYPPAPSFKPEGPLAFGYYRLPNAPNGEYAFYNPKAYPFNTQPTPAKNGVSLDERCGRIELVNMVYAVSKQWKERYGSDGSRVNVGDLNAPGHISHKNGVDVDIRTSDLSAANAPNARKYPKIRERSIWLAQRLIDNGARSILYNDTAIFSAVNSYGRSKGLNYDVMQYYANHDEHFHVRIGAKTVANNPLALRTEVGCP
jgi:hypothetical protein